MGGLNSGPGPGITLLIAITFIFVEVILSAPLYDEEGQEINSHALAETHGCYYNFQHYNEGERISTNEPCLNCTCRNRMLMCYLRVCPFTKGIGQNCTVEKVPGQCCPIITCPEVPVQLITSSTTEHSEDGGKISSIDHGSRVTGVGHLDNNGCSIDGIFYPNGAQVPASPEKPCELCYCIRNKTACIMQECALHVDGCRPVYEEGQCFPVRYQCDDSPYEEEPTTTIRPAPTPGLIITTTSSEPQECTYNNEIYEDGSRIMTEDPCEHCYCLKGKIACAVQECGTPLEKDGQNCTALPPAPGKCCPDSYQCDNNVIIQANMTSFPRVDRKHKLEPVGQNDITMSSPGLAQEYGETTHQGIPSSSDPEHSTVGYHPENEDKTTEEPSNLYTKNKETGGMKPLEGHHFITSSHISPTTSSELELDHVPHRISNKTGTRPGTSNESHPQKEHSSKPVSPGDKNNDRITFPSNEEDEPAYPSKLHERPSVNDYENVGLHTTPSSEGEEHSGSTPAGVLKHPDTISDKTEEHGNLNSSQPFQVHEKPPHIIHMENEKMPSPESESHKQDTTLHQKVDKESEIKTDRTPLDEDVTNTVTGNDQNKSPNFGIGQNSYTTSKPEEILNVRPQITTSNKDTLLDKLHTIIQDVQAQVHDGKTTQLPEEVDYKTTTQTEKGHFTEKPDSLSHIHPDSQGTTNLNQDDDEKKQGTEKRPEVEDSTSDTLLTTAQDQGDGIINKLQGIIHGIYSHVTESVFSTTKTDMAEKEGVSHTTDHSQKEKETFGHGETEHPEHLRPTDSEHRDKYPQTSSPDKKENLPFGTDSPNKISSGQNVDNKYEDQSKPFLTGDKSPESQNKRPTGIPEDPYTQGLKPSKDKPEATNFEGPTTNIPELHSVNTDHPEKDDVEENRPTSLSSKPQNKYPFKPDEAGHLPHDHTGSEEAELNKKPVEGQKEGLKPFDGAEGTKYTQKPDATIKPEFGNEYDGDIGATSKPDSEHPQKLSPENTKPGNKYPQRPRPGTSDIDFEGTEYGTHRPEHGTHYPDDVDTTDRPDSKYPQKVSPEKRPGSKYPQRPRPGTSDIDTEQTEYGTHKPEHGTHYPDDVHETERPDSEYPQKFSPEKRPGSKYPQKPRPGTSDIDFEETEYGTHQPEHGTRYPDGVHETERPDSKYPQKLSPEHTRPGSKYPQRPRPGTSDTDFEGTEYETHKPEYGTHYPEDGGATDRPDSKYPQKLSPEKRPGSKYPQRPRPGTSDTDFDGTEYGTHKPEHGTKYPDDVDATDRPDNKYPQTFSPEKRPGSKYPQRPRPGTSDTDIEETEYGTHKPEYGTHYPDDGDATDRPDSKYPQKFSPENRPGSKYPQRPRPGTSDTDFEETEYGTHKPEHGTHYPDDINASKRPDSKYPQKLSPEKRPGSNYPQRPRPGTSDTDFEDTEYGNHQPEHGTHYPDDVDATEKPGSKYPQKFTPQKTKPGSKYPHKPQLESSDFHPEGTDHPEEIDATKKPLGEHSEKSQPTDGNKPGSKYPQTPRPGTEYTDEFDSTVEPGSQYSEKEQPHKTRPGIKYPQRPRPDTSEEHPEQTEYPEGDDVTKRPYGEYPEKLSPTDGIPGSQFTRKPSGTGKPAYGTEYPDEEGTTDKPGSEYPQGFLPQKFRPGSKYPQTPRPESSDTYTDGTEYPKEDDVTKRPVGEHSEELHPTDGFSGNKYTKRPLFGTEYPYEDGSTLKPDGQYPDELSPHKTRPGSKYPQRPRPESSDVQPDGTEYPEEVDATKSPFGEHLEELHPTDRIPGNKYTKKPLFGTEYPHEDGTTLKPDSEYPHGLSPHKTRPESKYPQRPRPESSDGYPGVTEYPEETDVKKRPLGEHPGESQPENGTEYPGKFGSTEETEKDNSQETSPQKTRPGSKYPQRPRPGISDIHHYTTEYPEEISATKKPFSEHPEELQPIDETLGDKYTRFPGVGTEYPDEVSQTIKPETESLQKFPHKTRPGSKHPTRPKPGSLDVNPEGTEYPEETDVTKNPFDEHQEESQTTDGVAESEYTRKPVEHGEQPHGSEDGTRPTYETTGIKSTRKPDDSGAPVPETDYPHGSQPQKYKPGSEYPQSMTPETHGTHSQDTEQPDNESVSKKPGDVHPDKVQPTDKTIDTKYTRKPTIAGKPEYGTKYPDEFGTTVEPGLENLHEMLPQKIRPGSKYPQRPRPESSDKYPDRTEYPEEEDVTKIPFGEHQEGSQPTDRITGNQYTQRPLFGTEHPYEDDSTLKPDGEYPDGSSPHKTKPGSKYPLKPRPGSSSAYPDETEYPHEDDTTLKPDGEYPDELSPHKTRPGSKYPLKPKPGSSNAYPQQTEYPYEDGTTLTPDGEYPHGLLPQKTRPGSKYPQRPRPESSDVRPDGSEYPEEVDTTKRPFGDHSEESEPTDRITGNKYTQKPLFGTEYPHEDDSTLKPDGQYPDGLSPHKTRPGSKYPQRPRPEFSDTHPDGTEYPESDYVTKSPFGEHPEGLQPTERVTGNKYTHKPQFGTEYPHEYGTILTPDSEHPHGLSPHKTRPGSKYPQKPDDLDESPQGTEYLDEKDVTKRPLSEHPEELQPVDGTTGNKYTRVPVAGTEHPDGVSQTLKPDVETSEEFFPHKTRPGSKYPIRPKPGSTDVNLEGAKYPEEIDVTKKPFDEHQEGLQTTVGVAGSKYTRKPDEHGEQPHESEDGLYTTDRPTGSKFTDKPDVHGKPSHETEYPDAENLTGKPLDEHSNKLPAFGTKPEDQDEPGFGTDKISNVDDNQHPNVIIHSGTSKYPEELKPMDSIYDTSGDKKPHISSEHPQILDQVVSGKHPSDSKVTEKPNAESQEETYSTTQHTYHRVPDVTGKPLVETQDSEKVGAPLKPDNENVDPSEPSKTKPGTKYPEKTDETKKPTVNNQEGLETVDENVGTKHTRKPDVTDKPGYGTEYPEETGATAKPDSQYHQELPSQNTTPESQKYPRPGSSQDANPEENVTRKPYGEQLEELQPTDVTAGHEDSHKPVHETEDTDDVSSTLKPGAEYPQGVLPQKTGAGTKHPQRPRPGTGEEHPGQTEYPEGDDVTKTPYGEYPEKLSPTDGIPGSKFTRKPSGTGKPSHGTEYPDEEGTTGKPGSEYPQQFSPGSKYPQRPSRPGSSDKYPSETEYPEGIDATKRPLDDFSEEYQPTQGTKYTRKPGTEDEHFDEIDTTGKPVKKYPESTRPLSKYPQRPEQGVSDPNIQGTEVPDEEYVTKKPFGENQDDNQSTDETKGSEYTHGSTVTDKTESEKEKPDEEGATSKPDDEYSQGLSPQKTSPGSKFPQRPRPTDSSLHPEETDDKLGATKRPLGEHPGDSQTTDAVTGDKYTRKPSYGTEYPDELSHTERPDFTHPEGLTPEKIRPGSKLPQRPRPGSLEENPEGTEYPEDIGVTKKPLGDYSEGSQPTDEITGSKFTRKPVVTDKPEYGTDLPGDVSGTEKPDTQYPEALLPHKTRPASKYPQTHRPGSLDESPEGTEKTEEGVTDGTTGDKYNRKPGHETEYPDEGSPTAKPGTEYPQTISQQKYKPGSKYPQASRPGTLSPEDKENPEQVEVTKGPFDEHSDELLTTKGFIESKYTHKPSVTGKPAYVTDYPDELGGTKKPSDEYPHDLSHPQRPQPSDFDKTPQGGEYPEDTDATKKPFDESSDELQPTDAFTGNKYTEKPSHQTEYPGGIDATETPNNKYSEAFLPHKTKPGSKYPQRPRPGTEYPDEYDSTEEPDSQYPEKEQPHKTRPGIKYPQRPRPGTAEEHPGQTEYPEGDDVTKRPYGEYPEKLSPTDGIPGSQFTRKPSGTGKPAYGTEYPDEEGTTDKPGSGYPQQFSPEKTKPGSKYPQSSRPGTSAVYPEKPDDHLGVTERPLGEYPEGLPSTDGITDIKYTRKPSATDRPQYESEYPDEAGVTKKPENEYSQQFSPEKTKPSSKYPQRPRPGTAEEHPEQTEYPEGDEVTKGPYGEYPEKLTPTDETPGSKFTRKPSGSGKPSHGTEYPDEEGTTDKPDSEYPDGSSPHKTKPGSKYPLKPRPESSSAYPEETEYPHEDGTTLKPDSEYPHELSPHKAKPGSKYPLKPRPGSSSTYPEQTQYPYEDGTTLTPDGEYPHGLAPHKTRPGSKYPQRPGISDESPHETEYPESDDVTKRPGDEYPDELQPTDGFTGNKYTRKPIYGTEYPNELGSTFRPDSKYPQQFTPEKTKPGYPQRPRPDISDKSPQGTEYPEGDDVTKRPVGEHPEELHPTDGLSGVKYTRKPIYGTEYPNEVGSTFKPDSEYPQRPESGTSDIVDKSPQGTEYPGQVEISKRPLGEHPEELPTTDGVPGSKYTRKPSTIKPAYGTDYPDETKPTFKPDSEHHQEVSSGVTTPGSVHPQKHKPVGSDVHTSGTEHPEDDSITRGPFDENHGDSLSTDKYTHKPGFTGKPLYQTEYPDEVGTTVKPDYQQSFPQKVRPGSEFPQTLRPDVSDNTRYPDKTISTKRPVGQYPEELQTTDKAEDVDHTRNPDLTSRPISGEPDNVSHETEHPEVVDSENLSGSKPVYSKPESSYSKTPSPEFTSKPTFGTNYPGEDGITGKPQEDFTVRPKPDGGLVSSDHKPDDTYFGSKHPEEGTKIPGLDHTEIYSDGSLPTKDGFTQHSHLPVGTEIPQVLSEHPQRPKPTYRPSYITTSPTTRRPPGTYTEVSPDSSTQSSKGPQTAELPVKNYDEKPHDSSQYTTEEIQQNLSHDYHQPGETGSESTDLSHEHTENPTGGEKEPESQTSQTTQKTQIKDFVTSGPGILPGDEKTPSAMIPHDLVAEIAGPESTTVKVSDQKIKETVGQDHTTKKYGDGAHPEEEGSKYPDGITTTVKSEDSHKPDQATDSPLEGSKVPTSSLSWLSGKQTTRKPTDDSLLTNEPTDDSDESIVSGSSSTPTDKSQFTEKPEKEQSTKDYSDVPENQTSQPEENTTQVSDHIVKVSTSVPGGDDLINKLHSIISGIQSQVTDGKTTTVSYPTHDVTHAFTQETKVPQHGGYDGNERKTTEKPESEFNKKPSESVGSGDQSNKYPDGITDQDSKQSPSRKPETSTVPGSQFLYTTKYPGVQPSSQRPETEKPLDSSEPYETDNLPTQYPGFISPDDEISETEKSPNVHYETTTAPEYQTQTNVNEKTQHSEGISTSRGTESSVYLHTVTPQDIIHKHPSVFGSTDKPLHVVYPTYYPNGVTTQKPGFKPQYTGDKITVTPQTSVENSTAPYEVTPKDGSLTTVLFGIRKTVKPESDESNKYGSVKPEDRVTEKPTPEDYTVPSFTVYDVQTQISSETGTTPSYVIVEEVHTEVHSERATTRPETGIHDKQSTKPGDFNSPEKKVTKVPSFEFENEFTPSEPHKQTPGIIDDGVQTQTPDDYETQTPDLIFGQPAIRQPVTIGEDSTLHSLSPTEVTDSPFYGSTVKPSSFVTHGVEKYGPGEKTKRPGEESPGKPVTEYTIAPDAHATSTVVKESEHIMHLYSPKDKVTSTTTLKTTDDQHVEFFVTSGLSPTDDSKTTQHPYFTVRPNVNDKMPGVTNYGQEETTILPIQGVYVQPGKEGATQGFKPEDKLPTTSKGYSDVFAGSTTPSYVFVTDDESYSAETTTQTPSFDGISYVPYKIVDGRKVYYPEKETQKKPADNVGEDSRFDGYDPVPYEVVNGTKLFHPDRVVSKVPDRTSTPTPLGMYVPYKIINGTKVYYTQDPKDKPFKDYDGLDYVPFDIVNGSKVFYPERVQTTTTEPNIADLSTMLVPYKIVNGTKLYYPKDAQNQPQDIPEEFDGFDRIPFQTINGTKFFYPDRVPTTETPLKETQAMYVPYKKVNNTKVFYPKDAKKNPSQIPKGYDGSEYIPYDIVNGKKVFHPERVNLKQPTTTTPANVAYKYVPYKIINGQKVYYPQNAQKTPESIPEEFDGFDLVPYDVKNETKVFVPEGVTSVPPQYTTPKEQGMYVPYKIVNGRKVYYPKHAQNTPNDLPKDYEGFDYVPYDIVNGNKVFYPERATTEYPPISTTPQYQGMYIPYKIVNGKKVYYPKYAQNTPNDFPEEYEGFDFIPYDIVNGTKVFYPERATTEKTPTRTTPHHQGMYVPYNIINGKKVYYPKHAQNSPKDVPEDYEGFDFVPYDIVNGTKVFYPERATTEHTPVRTTPQYQGMYVPYKIVNGKKVYHPKYAQNTPNNIPKDYEGFDFIPYDIVNGTKVFYPERATTEPSPIRTTPHHQGMYVPYKIVNGKKVYYPKHAQNTPTDLPKDYEGFDFVPYDIVNGTKVFYPERATTEHPPIRTTPQYQGMYVPYKIVNGKKVYHPKYAQDTPNDFPEEYEGFDFVPYDIVNGTKVFYPERATTEYPPIRTTPQYQGMYVPYKIVNGKKVYHPKYAQNTPNDFPEEYEGFDFVPYDIVNGTKVFYPERATTEYPPIRTTPPFQGMYVPYKIVNGKKVYYPKHAQNTPSDVPKDYEGFDFVPYDIVNGTKVFYPERATTDYPPIKTTPQYQGMYVPYKKVNGKKMYNPKYAQARPNNLPEGYEGFDYVPYDIVNGTKIFHPERIPVENTHGFMYLPYKMTNGTKVFYGDKAQNNPEPVPEGFDGTELMPYKIENGVKVFYSSRIPTTTPVPDHESMYVPYKIVNGTKVYHPKHATKYPQNVPNDYDGFDYIPFENVNGTNVFYPDRTTPAPVLGLDQITSGIPAMYVPYKIVNGAKVYYPKDAKNQPQNIPEGYEGFDYIPYEIVNGTRIFYPEAATSQKPNQSPGMFVPYKIVNGTKVYYPQEAHKRPHPLSDDYHGLDYIPFEVVDGATVFFPERVTQIPETTKTPIFQAMYVPYKVINGTKVFYPKHAQETPHNMPEGYDGFEFVPYEVVNGTKVFNPEQIKETPLRQAMYVPYKILNGRKVFYPQLAQHEPQNIPKGFDGVEYLPYKIVDGNKVFDPKPAVQPSFESAMYVPYKINNGTKVFYPKHAQPNLALIPEGFDGSDYLPYTLVNGNKIFELKPTPKPGTNIPSKPAMYVPYNIINGTKVYYPKYAQLKPTSMVEDYDGFDYLPYDVVNGTRVFDSKQPLKTVIGNNEKQGMYVPYRMVNGTKVYYPKIAQNNVEDIPSGYDGFDYVPFKIVNGNKVFDPEKIGTPENIIKQAMYVPYKIVNGTKVFYPNLAQSKPQLVPEGYDGYEYMPQNGTQLYDPDRLTTPASYLQAMYVPYKIVNGRKVFYPKYAQTEPLELPKDCDGFDFLPYEIINGSKVFDQKHATPVTPYKQATYVPYRVIDGRKVFYPKHATEKPHLLPKGYDGFEYLPYEIVNGNKEFDPQQTNAQTRIPVLQGIFVPYKLANNAKVFHPIDASDKFDGVPNGYDGVDYVPYELVNNTNRVFYPELISNNQRTPAMYVPYRLQNNRRVFYPKEGTPNYPPNGARYPYDGVAYVRYKNTLEPTHLGAKPSDNSSDIIYVDEDMLSEPLTGPQGQVIGHVPGEGHCFINNQTYANNSEVVPVSPCQAKCKCVSSVVRCVRVKCPPQPQHNRPNCFPVYKKGNCCPTYECGNPHEDTTSRFPEVVLPENPVFGHNLNNQYSETHKNPSVEQENSSVESSYPSKVTGGIPTKNEFNIHRPSKPKPYEHESLEPYDNVDERPAPGEMSPDEDYDNEDEEPYGPGTCRYAGKVYVSAQQIPRDDPCDFCFCFRSDIICLQQSCPPPIPGCRDEPIQGFCCPRYECHVKMATLLNVTSTTTTTTTTLPPHFFPHAFKGSATRTGCFVQGKAYRVGQAIPSASGPCMDCICGGNGRMKCEPKVCTPEPMIRKMILPSENTTSSTNER